MVKFLISIIVFCFLAGIAFAGPFLVSDPQAGVTSYEVFINGAQVAAAHPAESDGSLKYDLAGTTPGQYEMNAKACNDWGCSELSEDPFFSSGPALPPSGLKLAP